MVEFGRLLLFMLILVSTGAEFLSAKYQKEFITAINVFRNKIKDTEVLKELEWSSELSEKALQFTDGCLSNSSIKEVRNNGEMDDENGLNKVLTEWYGQGETFQIKKSTCERKYGCYDYVNMMCNKTTKVGCGFKECTYQARQKACFVGKTCNNGTDCVIIECAVKNRFSIICLFDKGCYQDGVEYPKPYFEQTHKPKPVKRSQKKRRVPKKKSFKKI